LNLYNQYISSNHLDVGVGTGYFLTKCKFPTDKPRIALVDLNTNSLAVAKERLSCYAPITFCRDAVKPLGIQTEPFSSIAINGLLHCLSGTMRTKSVVFDNLKPLLKPGGIVFGCTILSKGINTTRSAKWIMKWLNSRGVFCNLEDGFQELKRELSSRFKVYDLRVIGCMALFWARNQ
jgi:ubiquinone/menaquinone biosynthesis C-methylase UbiE